MNYLKVILLLTFAVLFSTCSIQHRHYRNGYYIAWTGKKAKPTTTKSESFQTTSMAIHTQTKFETELSNSNVLTAISFQQLPEFNKTKTKKNSAFQSTVLKNKEASRINPEIIPSKNSKASTNSQVLVSEYGSSQLIALLLCVFFGVIGIHRFYLGYPGIAIIQILTFGGCGIWWLVDLIRIILGDLKPKNGEYHDEL